MDLLTAPLRDLADRLAATVSHAARERAFEQASDTELAAHLAAYLGAVAELGRLVDALLLDVVGEAGRRSENPIRDERVRAAKAVRPAVSDTTGELLPAPFPSVRDAVQGGVIGVDGVLAITDPLQQTAPRVSAQARRHAADVCVAEARGEGPDGAPPACADLLKIHAQTWALALDQDGAEPRERVRERTRSLTLGAPTPHGIPIRGTLLPDVAAQLQTIFDAHLAPTVTFDDLHAVGADGELPPLPAADDRTRPQKQHDALAAALSTAASSGLLPTIGGAAPTLVVHVDAADLTAGTGYAHPQGCDESISIGVARHIACSGVIQRITNRSDGRILRIGTEERVFNRHQRRAIALRDGGCIIPGCGVPAAWCEIHHVTEHAHGGPTHTDNGVLLCWYHHRFLDRIGWKIRTNNGTPEVIAPRWFDTTHRWRPVTTSPLRLRRKLLRT